jgi:hypothetical protein
VFLLQDVEEGGYLFLGDLGDLASSGEEPLPTEDAYEIGKFVKSPVLGSTTDFIRVAYLKKRKTIG